MISIGAAVNTADVASETALQTRTLRIGTILRDICCTVSSILTLSVALHPEMQAKPVQALVGFKRLIMPHNR